MPVTAEQRELSTLARALYKAFPYDGKYIMDGRRVIICQSHASQSEIKALYPKAVINPLGYWTGGLVKAQETGKPVELCCAIGDTKIDGRPYSEIVEIARDYIQRIGGFEKFAEWGLVR